MKILLPIVYLIIPVITNAQTEADIRKHYQEVNKQITESIETGYEGPLYNNRWISNNHGKSWPAVGRYTDTVDYWYDDPPDHLPTGERDPKTVLLKVNSTGQVSHYYHHEEFLFKNGVLLFYYSNQAEEGHGWETRIWFNSKGVIKTSVKVNELEITPKDPEYTDVAPDIQKVRKDAAKHQELFLKSMM